MLRLSATRMEGVPEHSFLPRTARPWCDGRRGARPCTGSSAIGPARTGRPAGPGRAACQPQWHGLLPSCRRWPVGACDLRPHPLIRRTLDSVGRTKNTALTAFTDGRPGLRRILADAGVTTRPMLDWFHIAMRLQHLKQIADGLSDDDPERAAAKTVIVTEVERLHWRIWNGKAKGAQISIDRIRAVMHHFRASRKGASPTRRRESCGPSCTRWIAI